MSVSIPSWIITTAIINIKRQLSGTAINNQEEKVVLRTQDQMLPEQIDLLATLLLWLTSNSREAEW